MNKIFLLLLMTALTLFACSNLETLHFEGQGDEWLVKYDIDLTHDKNAEKGQLTIKYIGDDQAPEQIYYDISNKRGKLSGEATSDDGIFKISGSNCSGCSISQKNDEFDTSIETDESNDQFILKPTESF